MVADPARYHARVGDDLDDYRRGRSLWLHADFALRHANPGADDCRYARQQMGVDAHDQRLFVGLWFLHPTGGDHSDDGAHSLSDHHRRWLRSHLVRRDYHDQYGDWPHSPT